MGGLVQRAVWRIIAVLAIAVAPAGAAFVWGAQAGQATSLPGEEPSRTSADLSAAQPAAAQGDSGPVIVTGMPGLRWSDVTRSGPPALWSLLERGSAAAMSVRTLHPRACPIDGWLTLGAGSRATARAG